VKRLREWWSVIITALAEYTQEIRPKKGDDDA
jgi:hypothetical protein